MIDLIYTIEDIKEAMDQGSFVCLENPTEKISFAIMENSPYAKVLSDDGMLLDYK